MSEQNEVSSNRIVPASGAAREQACRHLLADGRRCGGKRLKGRELCRWHEPEWPREAVARRGGEKEASGAEFLAASELRYLDGSELRGLLARTLARLERDPMSPGVAYATGYLVQLLLSLEPPAEPAKRWEDLTPEEREARTREMGRRVREIYGWSTEELDEKYGPRGG